MPKSKKSVQNLGPDSTSQDAWHHFLDDLENCRKAINPPHGEEIFYRGESCSSHSLLPGLLRKNWNSEKISQIEYDLFFEFSMRARDLSTKPLSGWDILFYMQHYGLPTRLLDWTTTIAKAVFFATLSEDTWIENDPPCLWILDAYTMNQISVGERDLFGPKYLGYNSETNEYDDYEEILISWDDDLWELPVALYPEQKNPRIFAQNGLFTIHGLNTQPLNKIKEFKGLVHRVKIPAQARNSAIHFLELAGVDYYSMFPELTGLSVALKKKYDL